MRRKEHHRGKRKEKERHEKRHKGGGLFPKLKW